MPFYVVPAAHTWSFGQLQHEVGVDVDAAGSHVPSRCQTPKKHQESFPCSHDLFQEYKTVLR